MISSSTVNKSNATASSNTKTVMKGTMKAKRSESGLFNSQSSSGASVSQFFLELNGIIEDDQLEPLLTRITAITNRDIDQQNLFEHCILLKVETKMNGQSSRTPPANALTMKAKFYDEKTQKFIKFNYRKWNVVQYGPPEPFKGTPVNYRSILNVPVEKDVCGLLSVLGFQTVGEYVKEGFRIEFQGMCIDIFRLYETHDRQVSNKTKLVPGCWLVNLTSISESSEINAKSIMLKQFGECLYG